MVIKDAPLIYLLRILARRFIEDRCMQVASSLTFTTLLALVPIVTVALTVASAFPVFGPLLVGASLSATSYLITLTLGLVEEVPGARSALLRFVPLALTSAAFALLYFTLPRCPVLKRDAVTGDIAAGAGFEVMKHGFGFYVAQFPTYTVVYGAFAAVPIFLLWIYLSWLVIIGGAVLVAALPEWRGCAGYFQLTVHARSTIFG